MNYVARMNTLKSWSTLTLTLALWSSAGCTSTIAGKAVASADNEVASEASSDMPKEGTIDVGNNVKMKLMLLPAGTFMMGSSFSLEETMKRFGGKPKHLSCEHPRHEVTISKPFYIGVYEVTQAEWKSVMGTEPWLVANRETGEVGPQTQTKAGDDYPADWMTSYQAIEFCEALSKKTGRKVSLPTEAQWEYAARGGATTAYGYGSDKTQIGDYAWYWGNTRNAKPVEIYAHKVGTKKPNPWGLYDMHGNLWEFCSDWFDKDFYATSPKVDPENTTETPLRAVRGGSWHNGNREARCAFRASWVGPKYVHYNYGFRVVVQP